MRWVVALARACVVHLRESGDLRRDLRGLLRPEEMASVVRRLPAALPAPPALRCWAASCRCRCLGGWGRGRERAPSMAAGCRRAAAVAAAAAAAA